MDFKKLLNKLTVLGGTQVLNESLDEVSKETHLDDLNIGDDVIITGPVEFEGKTGVVDSFGQNKDFVVVNLYNHGKHSFQASDVSLNDYADSGDEQERMHESSNDYFKRRKDEEGRIAGTKSLAKNKPKQTDYEKKRKEEKKVMEESKPDFLDIDKDGDKKEPMKKAAADKKANVKESTLAELIAKMDVIIDEAAKPDFLDIDKDGDKKEPMKKAAADSKKLSDKEQVDEVGTLGAMAVGAAIQGNHVDQAKMSANYMKQKAGHYAQAPEKPKFNPYVFNVQKPQQDSQSYSASNMRNKAKSYSEDLKQGVAEKKVMGESATDRVTFSGKDSQGNPKHVHFGKNNGRPYHVVTGKPGTNFEASAVIPPGAKGSAGSEEHMQWVAKLVHAGKHNDALKYLNKHSNIMFSKAVDESVELDEAKSDAIEAYGVRGMNSKQWRKTFKSQAAFEAWLAKNEGDVEVHGTRKLVGGVAESKLAECGGMSYDQDSGMSINTSIDTRTGSKTVSVTASGNSADDLMQILKLSGMNSESGSADQPSSSVKVVSMPMGYGVFGHSHEDEEIEETYANEPDEQIQPVDTQLQQGTDLNRQKPMYKHSYRQGDNPMAMQEARELARLEKEISEGIDSIKVKQPEHSGHRSAASAGSADSYYGRARKPNKSENGVKIYNLTPEEVKAYNKAYDENEESQSFKDWGRDE